MDTSECLCVFVSALQEGATQLQEYPDDSERTARAIRERIRSRLEHYNSAFQAGTVVVDFRLSSERHASSFYHGPKCHSVNRRERERPLARIYYERSGRVKEGGDV